MRFLFWLLLFVSLPASAQELIAYPDTLRLDPLSGEPMARARRGGPKRAAPYRLSAPVQLDAVRDEAVGVQVVVKHDPGAYPLKLTAPPGLHATVYRLTGIEIKEPSDSDLVKSLGPGHYPDPLIPTDQVIVPPPPAVGLLFIDCYVPRSASPGRHLLKLEVGDASLDLQIEVHDLTLPERDVARLGTVNFGSFLAKEKADPKHLLRWMQMAHAHRVSVEFMRPVPPIREDGAIDWEAWGARIGKFIDGSAFTEAAGYIGPRSGQPTVRFIIPLTDWWPVKATEEHLPSDPPQFSSALAAWERFVEQQGWFDKPNATDWILFINSLDEPKEPEKLTSIIAYKELIDQAQLSNRGRVFFRVDGNFGQRIAGWDDARQARELGPVVDLWNVHGAVYTIPWQLLARRRSDHSERVMFYISNSSGEPAVPPLAIDSPLVGARALSWIVARYALDGALNWEIDTRPGCIKNPKCSPGNALNLDANLIFRGEELGRAEHEPIASLRLKTLRRGSQDVALWSMLQKKDEATAQLIAKRIIPQALGDGLIDGRAGKWPQDPGAYIRARRALIDRLVGATSPLPLADLLRAPTKLEGGGVGTVLTTLLILALLIAAFLWARKRRQREHPLETFFSAPTFFVLCGLFIFYATTIPWDLAHAPAFDRVSWIPGWDAARGRIWSIPDMVQNVVLFLPFGFFGYLAFDRTRKLGLFAGSLLLGIAGLLLSLTVESLQTMSETRSPSATDLATNFGGALVGGAVAAIYHHYLAGRFRTSLSRTLREQPGFLICGLFFVAVVAGSLAPFIPTLDLGMLKGQVKLFLADPWGPKPIGALLADGLLFAALACLVAREVPTFLVHRRWLLRSEPSPATAILFGLLLVGGLAFGLECAQLVFIGHSPGLQDAVVGLVAAFVGAVLGGLINKSSHELGDFSRSLPALVIAFAVLLPVVRALSPFQFQPLGAALNEIDGGSFVPFWALFKNLNLSTFRNVFEATAVYLPLGYVVFLLRNSWKLGFLCCFLLAELLEVAQIPVAGRVFDITEGIYAGLMGLFGAFLFLWASSHSSAQPAPGRDDTRPI